MQRLGLLCWCVLLGSCLAETQTQSDWKKITPVARSYEMPMNSSVDASKPVRAVRLVFEYEGDQVRLVAEQPVEVPAAATQLAAAEATGFFVDARDANNRTLARVPAPHAFDTSVEVFPERPGGAITRTDVERPRGAFTVLVPASSEAVQVAIVNISRPTADVTTGVAVPAPVQHDLVSFPLRRNR